MAKILGPETEAMPNDEIIRRYGDRLKQLVKACNDPTYSFERIALLNQARLQWQMIRGQQNNALGWSNDDYGGQQPDLIPFDYGSTQEETGADIRLCPPVNFIGGDCYKFMAVMGSSSPRVKAVADDLRNPEDIQAATCADVNIRDLWTKNKIDRRWKIPAFHLYATGPCFVRTYWNTDPVKYGQSIEPKIEIVTDDQGNPVPKVVGEEAYDNGDAEVSFHSVLEVSIPWEAKELRGNFLNFEVMVSKWALLAQYAGKGDKPGPLDQYRDANVPDQDLRGDSITAAEARTATSNPSGTAQTKKLNQWRHSEWWFPPYLFEAVQETELREILKRQFSRGLYMAFVGSVPVEIDEREVTEEWVAIPVNRGEKIMDRPICADNVPLQRVINDLVGMAIETVLRAITQTIIDNQLIDRQAMSTKEAVPAEIILTAMPPDGDLRDKIFQIPPAHLSDQVIPLLNAVRAWGQDISGVRPELSGGGAPTQTFREAKQRKDQALAQLAPQAQSMQNASEDIATNLVILRSKYGTGTVKAQRRGAYGIETDVADMAELKTSGWHSEADDQFPLTLSDRRDTLFSLLKEFPPEVQAALSLLDPINQEEIQELLQIPGFASSIGEQKQKTLADINRLLESEPIEGEPGLDGQPGLPMPSVEPDEFDNIPLVAALVSKWLVSPAGQKHRGTPGFANVVAFWRVYNKMATPPAEPVEPPVKGSLSMSVKAESFPNLMGPMLEAAGVDMSSVNAGAPAPMPVPAPQQALPPSPQETPLPPMLPMPPQPGAIPIGS